MPIPLPGDDLTLSLSLPPVWLVRFRVYGVSPEIDTCAPLSALAATV